MADQTEDIQADAASWSQVWHLPTLLAGVLMLVGGIWLSLPEPQENDFPGVLKSAEAALAASDFDRAKAELDKITEHIAEASMTEQAQHWMARADLIYLRQRHMGVDLDVNHKNALDYYVRAKELGAKPDADQLERLAMTYIGLHRFDDAVGIVERMEEEPRSRRYGLVRTIIERRREKSALPPDALMELLTRYDDELRFEAEAAARRGSEIWSAIEWAELRITGEEIVLAIDQLNRKIQRLATEGGHDDLARLFLLLAQAHQRKGDFGEARDYFEKTSRILEPTDGLNAEVLVGLGQLDLSGSDDVESARSTFNRVVTEFPGAPVTIEALMGMGDCEAKLGWHVDSIDHLGQAARGLVESGWPEDPRRAELMRIARSHHALNFDKREYDRALSYLVLLVPLYAELPADLTLRFAVTHEQIARDHLRKAESLKDGSRKGAGVAFQEAAIQFSKAAEYYLEHAEVVTIGDDQAHGHSLWQAAVCYDDAELWAKSIDAYAQFVSTRASDPRHPRAVYRLGRAFQADQQYGPAITEFQKVIDAEPQSQVAIESILPLVQCLVELGEHDKAKDRLAAVLSDHPTITPDSEQYRLALVEAGRLHFRLGEYADAIARFATAVTRFVPEDPDGSARDAAALLFHLADSYQRSVAGIDAKLEEVLPQSQQRVLQRERTQRLQEAGSLYNRVIDRLEKRPAELLTEVELTHLRNSYFYRGDCAFQLRQWDEAITLYDLAAKRWEGQPASLVALVQIVNAHAEQGNFEQARLANERARFHLKRIPDEAFDDESLPMNRDHWRDWLRWSSELDLSMSKAE
ncbi:MAG: hypothetical protein CMJ18_20895 [Phycisphaeraceae bacterium]|nr:hypothetical protein [Phycisphaeraceae bacterium]